MPARVLVVAAQAAIQSQLGNMLRRDGYELLAGNDAQEGLRRWGTDRPDVIVVDSELSGMSAFDMVGHIRRSEPAGVHTPVILVGAVNDVDTKVRALRGGADDYLAKPVHPQELSARVRGLLARFARAPQPVAPQRVGRVHAYYGAKGGVGNTTLAINTAIAMHTELKHSVALVDANLQFGDLRVFLDMRPDQRSIVDAVSATAIDADLLRQVMVRHDSGVDVLLAPPSPESAELIRHDQHHLLRIVEVLKTMYDYVVIDLDKHLDDNTLDLIGAADKLVVVMTADVSCLKNVRLVLETMGQIGVPNERLLLVLNRSNAFTGISTKSVEAVLRRRIAQQIGNDYRSAISSLNSGTPFMLTRPESAIGRGVSELAGLLDHQTVVTAERGKFQLAPAPV